MKRVVFGQERRMIQLSPSCAGCGAPIGALHMPGCEAEECSSCGLALVYCRCGEGLSDPDMFFYTTTLSAQFNDLHHAEDFRPRTREDHPSLLENAALLRVAVDRPDRLNRSLEPSGWNEGKPMFVDGDVQQALLLNNEELHFIRELELERQPSPSNCWC